ncbi:MAG: thiamine pyrophosphate-dependent enzyme [Thermodesulfovibrionales bacterium]|nr:thiamine pyrophosphate-dependent enzyme [Thermodesulfovibrionales bacterium]
MEMQRQLLSGNEAIGRGAIEAGISLAVGYPGTPSTEIIEYLARHFSGQAMWAANEKVALEMAIGATYAGKRALCTMKHVGLNVALDPLMTAAYLGVKAGLVVIVADDPGAYSSQNEQDTRYLVNFAKIPCLEPSDSQEAKDMVIKAFDLSERFGLPVIVRSVTRVSHSYSPVIINEPKHENPTRIIKDPPTMIAVPSHVIACHKRLNEKQPKLIEWSNESGLNQIFKKRGQKKGIITCGVAYAYAAEFSDDFAILKIGAYPFDERIIKTFIRGLDEIWILEEGYPFIEDIALKYSKKIKGRRSGHIDMEGELGTEALRRHLIPNYSIPTIQLDAPLPGRPPVMCQGCPHREFYKSLNEAKPTFVAGDIGCYTLGAAPPLKALDTCLCMGASISKAAGMSLQGVNGVVAVIGDSTFIHSGITSLISAVYNKANILVAILDNSAVAMTGHQPTPATGVTAKGEEGGKIDLVELCKACGVDSIEVFSPYEDKEKNTATIKDKLNSKGVHVVISKAPCILSARKKKA